MMGFASMCQICWLGCICTCFPIWAKTHNFLVCLWNMNELKKSGRGNTVTVNCSLSNCTLWRTSPALRLKTNSLDSVNSSSDNQTIFFEKVFWVFNNLCVVVLGQIITVEPYKATSICSDCENKLLTLHLSLLHAGNDAQWHPVVRVGHTLDDHQPILKS